MYYGQRKIQSRKEKKIEIIKAYKAGEVAYSQLREVYGINANEIYSWISKYEIHREAAFRRGEGNARYSKEFKLRCVKEYLNGEGSLDNITAKYNLSAKWINHAQEVLIKSNFFIRWHNSR